MIGLGFRLLARFGKGRGIRDDDIEGADTRVDTSLLTIGDGLTLARIVS